MDWIDTILNNAEDCYHWDDDSLPSFDTMYDAIEYQTIALMEDEDLPDEQYDQLYNDVCDAYEANGTWDLEVA